MNFHDITHKVNKNYAESSSRPQFQGVRSWGLPGGDWIFELSFFPPLVDSGMSSVLLTRVSSGIGLKIHAFNKLGLKAALTRLKAQSRHGPVESYLKAHLVGWRLLNVKTQGDSDSGLIRWELEWGPESPKKLIFSLESAHRLQVQVLGEEGQVLFSNHLKLGVGNFEEITETSASSPQQSKTAPKFERLIQNISRDIEKNVAVRNALAPVVERLRLQPDWNFESEKMTPEVVKILSELEEGFLSKFKVPGARKKRVDQIFAHFKKTQKRIDGAQKRLQIVEAQRASIDSSDVQKSTPHDGLQSESQGETKKNALDEKPLKKPGIWVKLERAGVWARVGRSAAENAELFRQASSRDLWFHIKNFPGAHVWVPRGQKSWGAKKEPSAQLIHEACQLALINSRTSVGPRSEGEIEYTERLHLKALKGPQNQGKLLVMRSQTLYVKKNSNS